MNTEIKVYHKTNRATYFEDAVPGILNVVYRGRGAAPLSIMKVKNDVDGRNIVAALKKLNPTMRYRLHYRCPITGTYDDSRRFSRRGNVRMSRAKVIDVRFKF